nr:unnamed protein product [Callosobruchus chinensis]
MTYPLPLLLGTLLDRTYIYEDLNILSFKDVTRERSTKHHDRLARHSNSNYSRDTQQTFWIFEKDFLQGFKKRFARLLRGSKASGTPVLKLILFDEARKPLDVEMH